MTGVGGYPQRPGEDVRSPCSGVIGSCELPILNARNWKNSMLFNHQAISLTLQTDS